MILNKLEEFLQRRYTKTEALGIIIIIFAIGACLDIILGHFNLFSILFSIILILMGQRQRKKGKALSGNMYLTIGIIFLIGAFLISLAFYFVLAAIAIYYGYHLFSSTADPEKINVEIAPDVFDDPSTFEKKAFVKVEPFFKNMFVGKLRNIEAAYELDDINIQYGLGDIHIDLTYIMIPEGETVILIRGLAGNVILYIPYDVELSLHVSILAGKTNIFDEKKNIFNLTQKYQTADYQSATRKVKIITSVVVGDIEVRNV